MWRGRIGAAAAALLLVLSPPRGSSGLPGSGAAVEAAAPQSGERRLGFWRYLACEEHAEWSSFREAVARFREDGFPPHTGLAHEANALLESHGGAVDAMRFAQALADQREERRPEDCVYGLFAALFVRGREFLAMGDPTSAQMDFDLALRFLGRELGLDFLESSGWALRSADLLLAHPLGLTEASPPVRPSEGHAPPAAAAPAAAPRGPGQGPRAVDPHCAWWPCTKPLDPWPPPPPGRPITVAVYGYHPVIIEPISTLTQVVRPLVQIDLRWYGVHDRDCAFFAPLCSPETRRKAVAPIPGGVRYRAYETEEDVREVEEYYRRFWAAEREVGLDVHLVLCMEMRDAYFLWRVGRVATIYYPAIIFMQDEAFSDFGAATYLRQFDELRQHDVLSSGGAAAGRRPPGAEKVAWPPVAMVAQSPYIAESIFYHTKVRIPAIRPLALYVATRYAPNVTDLDPLGAAPALPGESRLLVLCARTRLMMSHSCRALFREARRQLPRRTPLSLHLPPGDSDVVHGLPFTEVARFTAVVLVPWNIAVTTFAELYAMHVPMFIPDSLWLARLWPKQMTSYGKAHPNLHRELRAPDDQPQHPTPYPSLDRIAEDFRVSWYWAEHFAHLHTLPGVHAFTSIPALLSALHAREVDLFLSSRLMREEAARALREVAPFWAGLVGRLVAAA